MDTHALKTTHPVKIDPGSMTAMAGPFDIPVYIEVVEGKIVAFHLSRNRKYSIRQSFTGACRLWSDEVEDEPAKPAQDACQGR